MTDLKIIGVHHTRLTDAWPEVGPLLDALAANSRGCFSTADYAKAIVARDMQLWAAMSDGLEGVMLTEIVNYPQKRVLSLVGTAGHPRPEWAALMPQIDRWAAVEGCSTVRAVHRYGLRPLLKSMGFKPWHEVSERDVNDV